MPYIRSVVRIGRQEGQQEGRIGERKDIIRNLLISRFGVLNEELETLINPLS